MRRAIIISIVVSSVGLMSGGTAARADFEFRQVAGRGQTLPGLSSPVASFGHWASINDQG